MNADDPFAAEPESTFIMPTPGQRTVLGTAQDGGTRVPSGAEATPAVEALAPARGVNPLVAAASPLLNAIFPLRAASTHRDPAALRETLARAVRAFEATAARSGVAPREVLAARYVLCTFLDETAASTPWGGSGAWAGQSLLVMFHKEAWGGEKVFQLMAKLAEDPRANRDLLELLYIVLSLGFEGRYRVIDNGRAQLDQLRERLLGMVQAEHGPHERELSVRWQGVRAGRAMFAQLPTWIVLALAGVAALALYLTLVLDLGRASDPLFVAIHDLRAPTPAPAPPVASAPPSAVPAASPRLAALLESDIRNGLVSVSDLVDRSVVTMRGDGLFQPGSSAVSASFVPLIRRIGDALAKLPGEVLVTGHTDNQPIRSARFPSNWHLSQERAAAVQELLAAQLPPARLKAEGRADTQPVAGHSTPAERAKNRRVEITLYLDKPPA